jgi:DsbC/DsbD-like thiol-disulfide interchange protein
MRSRLLAAALFVLGTQAPAQDPARPLAVTGLSPSAPLTIAAEATERQLLLRVEIQPGWHLYGRDTGAGKVIELTILEGSSFAANGALSAPVDAKGEITGLAEISLLLKRTAPGDSLRARFTFMACDPLLCLPPMEVLLVAPERPTVLLVAIAKDERSARIAAFLEARGFRPTVETYAAVTTAQCDAHDVVLADSPYFGQARGATKHADHFPETTSPIVAVGFLGTRLLEAQKVAMACGYI